MCEKGVHNTVGALNARHGAVPPSSPPHSGAEARARAAPTVFTEADLIQPGTGEPSIGLGEA
jgi:hypothetical protein